MQYVLICEDHAGQEALRKSVRDDHLEYIASYDVRVAGPMLAEDETTMIGSIIVIEAENMDAVRAFADGDPYAKAGLFREVTIRPYRLVISNVS